VEKFTSSNHRIRVKYDPQILPVSSISLSSSTLPVQSNTSPINIPKKPPRSQASSGSSSYASVKEMDHESFISSMRMHRESDESPFNTVTQTCERLENSAARDRISLSTLGERDENEQDLFRSVECVLVASKPLDISRYNTYLTTTKPNTKSQTLPNRSKLIHSEKSTTVLSSTPEELNINDEKQRQHPLLLSSRESLSKQQSYPEILGKSSIIDKQRNEDISSSTLKTPLIPLVNLTDIDKARAKLRLSTRRDRSADNVLLLSSSSATPFTSLVNPQPSPAIQRSVSFKRPTIDTVQSSTSNPPSLLQQLTAQSLYHQSPATHEQFSTAKFIPSRESRSDLYKTEDENTNNNFKKSSPADLTNTNDDSLKTFMSVPQPVIKSKQDYVELDLDKELMNNTQINEYKNSSRPYRDNIRHRNEQQLQQSEQPLTKATIVTTTFSSAALPPTPKVHRSPSIEHIYDNLDVFRRSSKDSNKPLQEYIVQPPLVNNDNLTSLSSVQIRDHDLGSIRQKRPTTIHVSSDKQQNEFENVWSKLQKQRSIRRVTPKQEEITKENGHEEKTAQMILNELEAKYDRRQTPSPEQQVPKDEEALLEPPLSAKLSVEKTNSIEQRINNRRKTVSGVQAKSDILTASTATKSNDVITTNGPSWIDIAKQKQNKYNSTKEKQDNSFDAPFHQQSIPIDNDHKKIAKIDVNVPEFTSNVITPDNVVPLANLSPPLPRNNTKSTTPTSFSPRSSSYTRRLSTYRTDSKDENNKPSSTLSTTTNAQTDYRSNRKSMYVGEPTPAMSMHERVGMI
ncbi:unnamed protein product, partial [Didymodactylos carnosus]